jgi:acetoacetyl-CoA synthetase
MKVGDNMQIDNKSQPPNPALKPIWRPSLPHDSIPINQYRNHINRKFNLKLQDSQELYKWSISAPQAFWVDLWSYIELIPELPLGTTEAYDSTIPINCVPRFFENACINYAENVLTQPQLSPDSPALIGIREGESLDGECWTWAELREQVRKLRGALQRSGVKERDRVAALISTSVWSVAIFLATASLGAIYTSIASDLGTEVS